MITVCHLFEGMLFCHSRLPMSFFFAGHQLQHLPQILETQALQGAVCLSLLARASAAKEAKEMMATSVVKIRRPKLTWKMSASWWDSLILLATRACNSTQWEGYVKLTNTPGLNEAMLFEQLNLIVDPTTFRPHSQHHGPLARRRSFDGVAQAEPGTFQERTAACGNISYEFPAWVAKEPQEAILGKKNVHLAMFCEPLPTFKTVPLAKAVYGMDLSGLPVQPVAAQKKCAWSSMKGLSLISIRTSGKVVHTAWHSERPREMGAT